MADEQNLVDLLTDRGGEDRAEDAIYELCNTIDNIVSSYDDPYDAFSELVQNALDAVAARYEEHCADTPFTPTVTVRVDMPAKRLTVIDNGTGIAWSNRRLAVKPNYSLKRRLGQTQSRGEEGAALTFLQFGHAEFTLSTKTVEDRWKYQLVDGHDWYTKTVALLEDPRGFSEKSAELPAADFELAREEEAVGDVGTAVGVRFKDDRLLTLLGEEHKTAKRRLGYILLTRTGIGTVFHEADMSNAEPWLQDLEVVVELVTEGKSTTWRLEPGFLYPHLMAKQAGARKTGLLTGNTKNNQVLYEFFDAAWIKKYLPNVAGNAPLMSTVARYNLQGYVAYAHQNSWYEDVSTNLLGLPEEAEGSALGESLIQVNGGFQVCVRGFPTGRRKSFLHRSGAEHKSRTFVLLNFTGDYKPDYGRKNLAADAHLLVLELCKELISYAASKREFLYRGTQQSTHSAKNMADAQQSLTEDAQRLRERGCLIKSGHKDLSRAPATETEVVAEFLRLVSDDVLPGFTIFGLLARGMLDGYFDYSVEVTEPGVVFDENASPLGLAFPEGNEVKYDGQWLEFKVASESLVDDFNKKPGESGKKYFGLVDLLVCERVDTATDSYDLLPVTTETYDERRFFGVTHILRSSGNEEHEIQVIALRDVRKIMHDRVEQLPDVTPVEA